MKRLYGQLKTLWAAVMVIISGAQAYAQDDLFTELTPLTDDILDEARGKFTLGGFEVEFGFSVSVNGEFVSGFATDATAVSTALSNAGIDQGALRIQGYDSQGTTIISNSLNDVILQQSVIVDMVIETMPLELTNPQAISIRDLPQSSGFSSF
ncbi:MAG: hypothetical protein AAF788_05920 [Pseudomonadota bacterium]